MMKYESGLSESDEDEKEESVAIELPDSASEAAADVQCKDEKEEIALLENGCVDVIANTSEYSASLDEMNMDNVNVSDGTSMDAKATNDEEKVSDPINGGEEVLDDPIPENIESGAKRSHRLKPISEDLRFDASLTSATSTASDAAKLALMSIEVDKWDTDAWISLVTEAQQGRSGDLTLREVYQKLLDSSQFPMSGTHWRALAQLEIDAGDSPAVDRILETALVQCANMELWQFYLEKMKRSALGSESKSEVSSGIAKEQFSSNDAQSEMTAAYELALRHVGMDIDAMPLWVDYLTFVKGWPERHGLDTGNKVLAMRKVYQRALGIPMDNLDKLWREYETFETGRSEHLAKAKFIPENIHRYQAAKAVYKERKQVWDLCDVHMLAVPPKPASTKIGSEQAKQLQAWKKRIEYEKENPERVDESNLRDRLKHTYTQCLCCMRFFPEIWQDMAQWELTSRTDGYKRAAQVYSKAIQVLPHSELLRIAKADLEESRGRIKEAKQAWKEYQEAFPCSTLWHIMYQKFIRRQEGKEAARLVFANSLPLRKAGKVGHEVYIAHANMELHVNGEPEVAQRVMEYGITRHGDFILEPAYVMAYIDVLLFMRDEANLRVLLERVLSPNALPTELARPIWDRFIELELWRASTGGNLSKAEAIEARRYAAYPNNPSSIGLGKTWHRCMISGVPSTLLGTQDLAFLSRAGISTSTSLSLGADDASLKKPVKRKRWESADKAADRIKAQEGDSIAEQTSLILGTFQTGGMVYSSIPPMVPPFLHKLYLMLPRHSGPTSDIDTLLSALRTTEIPPQNPEEQRQDAYFSADNQMLKASDNDDFDLGDESEVTHQRPVHDVFRARQLAKLESVQ